MGMNAPMHLVFKILGIVLVCALCPLTAALARAYMQVCGILFLVLLPVVAAAQIPAVQKRIRAILDANTYEDQDS